jgi:hypothetical protein
MKKNSSRTLPKSVCQRICCKIALNNQVAGVKVCLRQDQNFKTYAVHACSNVISQKEVISVKIKSFKQMNALKLIKQ